MRPNYQLAALKLLRQRLDLQAINSLSTDCRPNSISEGYALQAALNSLLSEAGMGEQVGHKIGCTTAVMQSLININHPCAGRIFSKTVMHGHGSVPRSGFMKIGAECEIAVRLAQDLPVQSAPYTKESVRHAVGAVMAAMELVDDRYQEFGKLGVPTLIADNFFNAGCVLGEPVSDWQALDLAGLEGTTVVNGSQSGRGSGSFVMGHPLNALAWLANSRREYGLPALKAGEFILLGSLVETIWLQAGDQVKIAISGLGELRLDVTA